jgi:hypothetical protein
VDPNSARAALRLDPALPLSPGLIEHAYEHERSARHPSLYPNSEGRAAAEAWALTLAAARDALLAEFHATAPPAPQAPQHQTIRRRRRGATAWIVAASVAGAALVVGAGFGLFVGLQAITERVIDGAHLAEQQARLAESQAVDEYSAGETAFTFPAALEIYNDGRLWDECDAGYADGCWQQAVIPEQSCDRLEVVLGFSTDEFAWEPEATEALDFDGVTASDSIHVVFGNDEYPYGWIHDVQCLDGSGV